MIRILRPGSVGAPALRSSRGGRRILAAVELARNLDPSRWRAAARWSKDGSTSRQAAMPHLALAVAVGLILASCGATQTPSSAGVPSSASPLARPAPSAPPTAPASPAPVQLQPRPLPPLIGRDWQRLVLPAQIPDGELTDVAVDARGWIAIGRSGLPATGGVLVMTSPDGRTWTAADPASFAKAELNGASVAVGPTSRVIMGQGGVGGTAVWRAGLDGRWVKAALPKGTEAYVDDVAFGHGRFVAVGPSGPMGEVGAAWESADGLTWRAARPFPGRAVGAIAGVASTAGGFLAAGAVADGAAVWSSADGITWSRPTLLPGGNTTTAGALAVGPGGIVIAADLSPGVTWTSTDGTTWRKETIPDADSGVFGVAALGAGFILAGGLSQGLDLGFFATRTTISSPWQAFPPLLDFRQAFPGRFVAAPDGSLVVGVGSDRDRRPAIFVSPPR